MVFMNLKGFISSRVEVGFTSTPSLQATHVPTFHLVFCFPLCLPVIGLTGISSNRSNNGPRRSDPSPVDPRPPPAPRRRAHRRPRLRLGVLDLQIGHGQAAAAQQSALGSIVAKASSI